MPSGCLVMWQWAEKRRHCKGCWEGDESPGQGAPWGWTEGARPAGGGSRHEPGTGLSPRMGPLGSGEGCSSLHSSCTAPHTPRWHTAGARWRGAG